MVIRTLELPPSDGQALSAIVQSVERQDLGIIRSVEYERDWWKLNGRWEVSVCKERCVEIYIDARSGMEERRKSGDSEDPLPPMDGKALSAISRSVEERKAGVITEMEFEDGRWEVELRRNYKKSNLNIDPRTGQAG
jgi:hypothetical protein